MASAAEQLRCEGRELGNKEALYKLAKDLLAEGISEQIIMKATGLSLAQIHQIKEECIY